MSFRYALGKYITNPEQDLVAFHDDDYVIMKDGYPKALRHYLVLPRNESLTYKHPVDAMADSAVYYETEEYVEKTKDMIVADLVKEGYVEDSPIAKEKFRNTFIRAGVHSVPSMAHLHIHVITQDFHLERMKNKKHYNSFTTLFFIDFLDLRPATPTDHLSPDSDADSHSDGLLEGLIMSRPPKEKRARPSRNLDYSSKERILRTSPLKCVYCGKTFGNQFKALKEHLAEEFSRKYSASYISSENHSDSPKAT
ncbi:hypothetical protein C7M61_000880 [Candidozyma pseudohaemuli]|uniref:Aprataxin C2HE/C2H2/C2HC zinc finger domain-containing protein n=1 Tax=Candidozyma pseudohaemuli TaxID=418784 RepID=A0A2P7YZ15_9ASCO|nr:hypothetical protein C7M61_000880 [[Candida] pseudohaemulonii]PSK41205.1 hypothetical protein C7M61_000880 [[Candida] pseudohaemulonii]